MEIPWWKLLADTESKTLTFQPRLSALQLLLLQRIRLFSWLHPTTDKHISSLDLNSFRSFLAQNVQSGPNCIYFGIKSTKKLPKFDKLAQIFAQRRHRPKFGHKKQGWLLHRIPRNPVTWQSDWSKSANYRKIILRQLITFLTGCYLFEALKLNACMKICWKVNSCVFIQVQD